MRNTTSFASSLLRKKDKVLMLLKASSLYFNQHLKNEERVSEILKKALKFAKNATKRDVENASVYVSILDKIIYLLERDLHSVAFADPDDGGGHQHLHEHHPREPG